MNKIVHFTYGLQRGGIETWLMHLAKHMDAAQYELVLAHHGEASCAIAADLRAAGYQIERLPSPRSPLSYWRSLTRFLADHGAIAAVHSHLNFAGIIMRAARKSGIPVRIAHSHVGPGLRTDGIVAGNYVSLTNRLFLSDRTLGIAASEQAAITLFGENWRALPDIQLMPCGIDFEEFRRRSHPGLRERLGIEAGRKVIAMIGRLSPEKNHALALRVMALLVEDDKPPCLLVVGDGPERAVLEDGIQRAGLGAHVMLLGERPDVPALLQEVADILVLPSLTEGSPLPLAVLEAHAAGIPCLVSDAIPRPLEGEVAGIRRLSLAGGAQSWAAQIREILLTRRGGSAESLEHSVYDIRSNARLLAAVYQRALSPESRGAAT